MTESFDRAAIKARAEAATPGPWTNDDDKHEPGIWGPKAIVLGVYTARDDWDSTCWELGTSEDREFIAHAREDIPALLDALEEAERERDEALTGLFNVYEELGFDTDGERNALHFAARTKDFPGLVVGCAKEHRAEAEAESESAERRIAAVEAVLEKPVYLRIVHQGWSEEDYSRPLVEANAIRAALHPVAETPESEKNGE